MTEYIYIASDKPLAIGSYGDKGMHLGKVSFYLTTDNFSSFYFEEDDFDLNLKLSKKDIYKVSSEGYSLPEEGDSTPVKSEKKAATILFNYISDHFKRENPNSLTILFRLNDHSVDNELKKEIIRYKNLKLKDIYYSEQRLLEIVR